MEKLANGKINYYNDIHFCHVNLFNTLINTTFKFMTILILKTEVTLDKLTFNNSHLSIKSLSNDESYYKVV